MLGLSLVDEHEVDRDLLLTEMIRRETLRSTNTLNLLGQRLGVLAAAPASRPTPCHWHRRHCARWCAGSPNRTRWRRVQLALYRSFERQVLERLGDILDRANALLAQHGVLPGLVYTPTWHARRARGGSSPSRWAVAVPSQPSAPRRH
jgi:hypothetical protein